MSTGESHQYINYMKYYSNRIKEFTKLAYNREIELNFKYYSDFDGRRLIKLNGKTLLINTIRVEGLCKEIQECILISASIYLYIYLTLLGFTENDIKSICRSNFPELYINLIKILKTKSKTSPLMHL